MSIAFKNNNGSLQWHHGYFKLQQKLKVPCDFYMTVNKQSVSMQSNYKLCAAAASTSALHVWVLLCEELLGSVLETGPWKTSQLQVRVDTTSGQWPERDRDRLLWITDEACACLAVVRALLPCISCWHGDSMLPALCFCPREVHSCLDKTFVWKESLEFIWIWIKCRQIGS